MKQKFAETINTPVPDYPFWGRLCLFQESVNSITYTKQRRPLCPWAKANIPFMNI